jgi:hypothetical protein
VGFDGEGRGFYCFEVHEHELEKAAFNSALLYMAEGNMSA